MGEHYNVDDPVINDALAALSTLHKRARLRAEIETEKRILAQGSLVRMVANHAAAFILGSLAGSLVGTALGVWLMLAQP